MAKAKGPKHVVLFRRRREGRTNYSKRLALVKSGKPRMVVRSSNKGIIIQFVEFTPKGDLVLVQSNSIELKKYKWTPRRNLPTAYLTGLLAGIKAKKAGISSFILDIGLVSPIAKTIPFAALKGALDSGLQSPHGENIFDDERIKGLHIESYASSLDETEYKKVFSSYLKEGFDPRKLTSLFEEAKNTILKV